MLANGAHCGWVCLHWLFRHMFLHAAAYIHHQSGDSCHSNVKNPRAPAKLQLLMRRLFTSRACHARVHGFLNAVLCVWVG
jgi:hypothetical protein